MHTRRTDTVYTFRAALWCDSCVRNTLKDSEDVIAAFPDLWQGGGHLVSTDDMIRAAVTAAGRNPDNESTWDSDQFPKNAGEDGGGESDTPQHCGCCGVFLENPLTNAGLHYAIDQLIQHSEDAGDTDCLPQWREFYGSDGVELSDGSVHDLADILSLVTVLPRWVSLRSVGVNDDGMTDMPFETFPAGTDIEDIWHALERECESFSAGDAMQGRYAGIIADYLP